MKESINGGLLEVNGSSGSFQYEGRVYKIEALPTATRITLRITSFGQRWWKITNTEISTGRRWTKEILTRSVVDAIRHGVSLPWDSLAEITEAAETSKAIRVPQLENAIQTNPQALARAVRDIIARCSEKKAGLLTDRLLGTSQVDRDLMPLNKIVDLIVELYTREVLAHLEREGHLIDLVFADVRPNFGLERTGKVYRALRGSISTPD